MVMVMMRAICGSVLWNSCPMAVRQKVTRKKSNASSNQAEKPAITAGGWLVFVSAAELDSPRTCLGSVADMTLHLDELQYQTLSESSRGWKRTGGANSGDRQPENQARCRKPAGEVCHLKCWARCAIASFRTLSRIAGQLRRSDLSTIHHRLSSVVEAAQARDYAAAGSGLLFVCAIS